MNKAKEILYKHAKSNNCKSDLLNNPFLEQAVLNAINEAINYNRCFKGDNELLVCDVDYLGNFTKGVKYLCKPDGLKHFEVEDDFGGLYKLHRKLFKKN